MLLALLRQAKLLALRQLESAGVQRWLRSRRWTKDEGRRTMAPGLAKDGWQMIAHRPSSIVHRLHFSAQLPRAHPWAARCGWALRRGRPPLPGQLPYEGRRQVRLPSGIGLRGP